MNYEDGGWRRSGLWLEIKLEREAREGPAGLNIVPLLWKSGQSLTAGQEWWWSLSHRATIPQMLIVGHSGSESYWAAEWESLVTVVRGLLPTHPTKKEEDNNDDVILKIILHSLETARWQKRKSALSIDRSINMNSVVLRGAVHMMPTTFPTE